MGAVAASAALKPGATVWSVLDFALVLAVARVAVYHVGFPSRVLTGEAFDHGLDLRPRRLANTLDHAAALAQDDPLLALALHVDHGRNIGHP